MLSNTHNEINRKKSLLSILLGAYVLLIGIGLPLVVRDRYFDILIFKYFYYCFCTIFMLFLLLLFFLTNKTSKKASGMKRINIKNIINNFSKVDILILLYWFVALLSTLTSDYLYESFWGNEGRYTGLFLITLYVLSYFCVSQFWIFKGWYIESFIATGIVVCMFGITDYFKLDILRFKELMLESQRPIFTSTIGNINTYTAYVGVVIGIAAVLFATEKNTLKMYYYYVCMTIGFFAIIMGVSDNAYLSLAILFALLPIYLFRNSSGLKRYLIIIATFFSVSQCIDWINTFFSNNVLGIDSAFNLVISFKWLHYIVLSLWLLIIIFIFFERRKDVQLRYYGKRLIYIWITIISIVMFGLVSVLYDCNVSGNVERYRSVSNYLVFNDDWGTHRGYIWRNAMECFLDLPIWKKIVGYGPETFGILLLRKTVGNPYNEIFDSAHNEYLHSLITVGILGLTFYVSALVMFIKSCFVGKSNNSYIIAIAFGVICYSTQAFVNLNLPIVTPILWLLLSIGSAKSLNEVNI